MAKKKNIFSILGLSQKDQKVQDTIISKAIKRFEKILEGKEQGVTDNYESLFTASKELKEKGLDETAIFIAAIEKYPEDEKLYSIISRIFIEKNIDTNKAIEILKKALNFNKLNIDIYAHLANHFKKENNLNELEKIYESVLTLDKSLFADRKKQKIISEAEAELTKIYAINLNKSDKAENLYRKIIENKNETPEILRTFSHCLLSKKAKDEVSLSIYQRSAEHYPDDLTINKFLSEYFFNRNDYKNAAKYLDNMFSQEGDAQTLDKLLICGENGAESKTYRRLLEEKYEANKRDADHCFKLANYYLKTGELDERKASVVWRALKYDPNNEQYLKALGRFSLNKENWKDVVEIFERMFKLGVLESGFYQALALGYANFLRRDKNAIPIYEKAIEQGLENKLVFNLLVEFYIRRKRTDVHASKIYTKALKFDPSNIKARRMKTICLFNEGDYKSCIEYGSKIILEDPSDIRILTFIAQALSKISDSAMVDKILSIGKDGLVTLEEAYKMSPHNKFLATKLTQYYLENKIKGPRSESVFLFYLNYINPENTMVMSILQEYYTEKGLVLEASEYDDRIIKTCYKKYDFEKIDFLQLKDNREYELFKLACLRALDRYQTGERDDEIALQVYYHSLFHNPEDEKSLNALINTLVNFERKSLRAIPIYDKYLTKICGATSLPQRLRDESRTTVPDREVLLLMLEGYIENEIPEFAIRKIIQILKENPDDTDILEILIDCLCKHPIKDSKLIILLETLHNKNPESEKICLALSYLYNQLKKFDEPALKIYEKALRLRSDDLILLTALAKSLENTSHIDEAINIYERILNFIPDTQMMINRLAYKYIERGEFNEFSLEVLKKANESDPFDSKIHLLYAQALYECEMKKEAIEKLEEYVHKFPEHKNDAMTLLEDIAKISPFDEHLYLYLATLHIKEKEFIPALNLFKKMGSIDASLSNTIIQELNKLEPVDQSYIECVKIKGYMYKLLGDYEKAVEELEKIIKTNQNDIEAIDLLMSIYLKQLSATNYSENGKYKQLLQKIGTLNIYQGKLENAIAIFQNFLAEDENNAEARKNLGICYQMKGWLELAYYYFQGIEIDDKTKYNIYDLGYSFYQSGMYEKSIDVWRWIIDQDPNFLDVSDKLKSAEYELAEK